MEDTPFDGWADLGAQRQAEDEALVQRYAAGEGRSQDMRPVRGFVQHVRRDIGAKGVICQVRMTVQDRGREICVWFYFPQDGRPVRPQTVSVTDGRSVSEEPGPGDLAACPVPPPRPRRRPPGRPRPRRRAARRRRPPDGSRCRFRAHRRGRGLAFSAETYAKPTPHALPTVTPAESRATWAGGRGALVAELG